MGECPAQIEVVRGRLDGAGEQELLSFWERRAGFTGEAARARLPEVVCVARVDGALVGVSSAYEEDLELVGGRRFFVFRCLLDDGLEDCYRPLFADTFRALDAERPAAPIGLCALLDERQRRLHPEAEWSDPRTIYAGYLQDGRQVRLAYFTDQVSKMPIPEPPGGWTPPGYRFEPIEQSGIDPSEVVSVWVKEGGLAQAEAERRLAELLLVAIDPQGSLAAISTAYLASNRQLRGDAWKIRGLVRPAHERSNLGVAMSVATRDRLIERFTSGEDTRGLGALFEVENEGLKRAFPLGLWFESGFLLIGDSARGDHVRVYYFPGVHAPEPSFSG